MKERPILFSTPMVKAILAGSKTQTRRVIKPQPDTPFDKYALNILPQQCPYGAPGDRLWVRETFLAVGGVKSPKRRIVYKSTNGLDGHPEWLSPAWAPSIHMPRNASQITLEVVSVRVEMVRDITEADAKAEGAVPHEYYEGAGGEPFTYREAFEDLWNSINEKRGHGWDVNPWVWVVEFRRVDTPA